MAMSAPSVMPIETDAYRSVRSTARPIRTTMRPQKISRKGSETGKYCSCEPCMAAASCHNAAMTIGNALYSARDLAHVWHPCTQMKAHEDLPMIPVRRGSGVWLEDFE